MRRLLLLCLVGLLVVPGASSHAAPFSYTDPLDQAAVAGADIVSVSWSTTGKGRGKDYQPRSLVVSMTLAAPPVKHLGYEVAATVEGCGAVIFHWSSGDALRAATGATGSVLVQCGGSANPTNDNFFAFVDVVPSGSTLTWSVPIASLPRAVRVGTVLQGHQAVVDVVEPATGNRAVEGPTAPGLLDTASTSASWKIS